MAYPRQWRNTSHLYLPNLDVFATTIAKVGNTAVKSFLVAAEHTAGERGNVQENPEARLLQSAPAGMAVHEDHSILRGYGHPGPIPRSATSVLVLRDPVERFLSMWVDRLLLQQHGGLLSSHPAHPEWFPLPWDDLTMARSRLRRLAEECADGDVLFADAHWIPQFAWLTPSGDYRIVLDMPDLYQLPRALAEADARLSWLGPVQMLTRHESSKELQQLLLTEDLADLIMDRYARDVRLRENFGLHPTWARLLVGVDEDTKAQRWESWQEQIYRRQFDGRLAEIVRLRKRIDRFESRWVFTAYARTRHTVDQVRNLVKATRTSIRLKGS